MFGNKKLSTTGHKSMYAKSTNKPLQSINNLFQFQIIQDREGKLLNLTNSLVLNV